MISAEVRAPAVPAWLAPMLRTSGALLAAAPFLPPLADRAGFPALAALLDAPWTSACHRMPERSLFLFGEPMPLCTRCLGLVVGLGLGLAIAWPPMSLRALRIAFGLGCAFLFLELTTQDLGWHPVFHPTRILSGLLVAYPVGAAAGAIAKKLAASGRAAALGASDQSATGGSAGRPSRYARACPTR